MDEKAVWQKMGLHACTLLASLSLCGCEAVAYAITAPLFIAEGAKESYDRHQTEKQEGHPYGQTP